MKSENQVVLEFPSRSSNEAFARVAAAGFAMQLDPTLEELGDIKTAVSEAVTNAIVHGYPENFGRIVMKLRIREGNILEIVVKDWGVGTLVMMKAIHPTIAGLVELVPPFIGFLLMCFLYAVYAADVVVTAVAASDLARELDALENVADSIHAVSDAMTEILGTTAMEADQKLDENRLQFKLAAAEARDAAAKLSPKEAAEAMRRKADEARDAARRASEISRLNAAEAAKAVKLAAKGTAERTAELLQLEQLAEELAARSEELRARTRRTAHFGKGRMLRAYPRLRHGTKQLTLDELRERLKYEHKHSA